MPDTEAPVAAPVVAPPAPAGPRYVVTVGGFGFDVGHVLTDAEVAAAKARVTLDLFTVRTMKGA